MRKQFILFVILCSLLELYFYFKYPVLLWSLCIIAPIIFTILKKIRNSKKIYIEKHVKLKNSKGPDASTSITTEQLKELISQIRIIEKSRF